MPVRDWASFVLKGRRVPSDEVYVEREASSQESAAAGPATLTPDELGAPANGGFPEPPPGGVVRVVTTQHEACGGETRVRLPVHLPAGAVRRVVCRSCAQVFEAPSVEEVELLEPAPAPRPARIRRPAIMTMPAQAAQASRRRPRLPAPPLPSLGWLADRLPDPRGRGWRLFSIPIAAIAVIAGLMAIQGGSDDPELPFADAIPAATEAPTGPGPREARGSGAGADGAASFVRESSFSLALPSGWQRTNPSGGATFAAASAGGDADVMLWIERDPGLSFSSFEARSLDQLRALAGSAQVVERIAAPTPEGTVVRLAADAPAGSPAYEVTLRSSGPYLYYLAATVQPDASREAVDGAELVQGSFVPSGADSGAAEGAGKG